ncbi:MAG: HYExAFE family protein [Phycisphaeraceae bacterium]|nr:HYExAFE family protein [Phycisphaeraceae bacterium]
MAQRRFHYDLAFETYLRERAIPYVAVDEAKRAIAGTGHDAGRQSLKSFDFVVYGSATGRNLLVDVKGRKHAAASARAMQNWVTRDDVESLVKWEGIFGKDFEGVFVFLYWCLQGPPDSLFGDILTAHGRSYALLAVRLRDYQAAMRHRSTRWDTVSLPAADFQKLAVPLKELL